TRRRGSAVSTAIITALTPRRSPIGAHLAFVPPRQRNARQTCRRDKKHHAGRRYQHERRKKPRNVELDAREQDLVREAGALATGPRDEFGDDSADQRETACDAQAAEEVRQRARHAQSPQRLPAGGAGEPEKVEQAAIDAAQAERRVGDDREDRHDDGAKHQGLARIVHPDDDERCDRYDRRHLQQDRVGEKAHLDPAALHEKQRGRHAEERRECQRGQRDAERDGQRMDQQHAIRIKRFFFKQKTAYEIRRNPVDRHQYLPCGKRYDRNRERRADAQQRRTPRGTHLWLESGSASALACATLADKYCAYAANAGDRRNASPRGNDSSTREEPTRRPGCAAMTATRVDRNTASWMLCVTKTTVKRCAVQSESS